MKTSVTTKSGNMFTNEIEFDETITTVMDDKGRFEDVVMFIADDGCYIRQYNEKINRYDLIHMSHEMFKEMIEALNHKEGFFVTRFKKDG